MRKAYLHHEPEPDYTKVVKYTEASTVRDLVAEFVAAFSERFYVTWKGELESLVITNEDGKQLALGSRAAKALSDGADLYIEGLQPGGLQSQQGKEAANAALSSPGASAASQKLAAAFTFGGDATFQHSTGQPSQPSKQEPVSIHHSDKAQTKAVGNVTRQSQELAITQTPQALLPLLERAAAARTAKNYRLAGEIYNKVRVLCCSLCCTLRAHCDCQGLKLCAHLQLAESIPGLVEVHEAASNMWLHEARMPQRALPHAQQLSRLQASSSTAHRLLGDVQL